MKTLAVALAVLAAGLTAGAAPQVQQSPDKMMGEDLYAAYLSSGPAVLSGAFPTNTRFEEFRKNFNDRVFDKWGQLSRERSKAMFMFDVALAAFPDGYVYWADFFQLGQTYLRRRPVPVGTVPEWDAFELQWNKTVIAFLAGRRNPDLVDTLARPLIAGRIIPVMPGGAGRPALVDPWIALLAGFVEEGYIIEDPKQIGDRGRKAIAAYEKAAAFEATRAEAIVRVARLLLDSKHPLEAIAALDRLRDEWTSEGVVIYWSRLIRGKALAALDRMDDAIKAYVSALEIVPSAQSPRVGIMALEAKRGRPDAAEAISRDVKTAGDPVSDPWWIYQHGDIRFFPKLEKTLREMASK
jgi:hypothetical protein